MDVAFPSQACALWTDVQMPRRERGHGLAATEPLPLRFPRGRCSAPGPVAHMAEPSPCTDPYNSDLNLFLFGTLRGPPAFSLFQVS